MSLRDLVSPRALPKKSAPSRTHRVLDDPDVSRAARMKALHADPEFKAKAAARMKARNAEKKRRRIAAKIVALSAVLADLEDEE